MESRTGTRTRTNYSTVIILFGLLIAELVILPMRVRGNADREFSIEGLGCDSCGKDCSAVCGSRQFRSCCFNYIKKRSGSSAHANNDANVNNNLLSPSSLSLSSFGMAAPPDLDASSSSLSPSSSSARLINGRKEKTNKINQNTNSGGGVGGGGGASSMEDTQQQQNLQFFPSISFGSGGIISSISPIMSARNPSKNWNTRVFLVTETEVPDRLIRRYLSSPSSSSPQTTFLTSSGSASAPGIGTDTSLERLMRNRLLSTSSASVPSSNWISIPNQIDKSMFQH